LSFCRILTFLSKSFSKEKLMKGILRTVLLAGLILTVIFVAGGVTYAQSGPNQPPFPSLSNEGVSTYIIRLSDPSLAAYRGGIEGLAPTSPRATGAAKLDVNSPESQAYLSYLAQQRDAFLQQASEKIGRQLTADRVFDVVYNGLTLQLTEAEVGAIGSLPMVRKVQKDYMKYPLTDHGPEWIGAPSMWGPRNS
jgi:hypothetical protein